VKNCGDIFHISALDIPLAGLYFYSTEGNCIQFNFWQLPKVLQQKKKGPAQVPFGVFETLAVHRHETVNLTFGTFQNDPRDCIVTFIWAVEKVVDVQPVRLTFGANQRGLCARLREGVKARRALSDELDVRHIGGCRFVSYLMHYHCTTRGGQCQAL
jgi:hypothetical protein